MNSLFRKIKRIRVEDIQPLGLLLFLLICKKIVQGGLIGP